MTTTTETTMAAADLEAYFGELAAALRTGLSGSERFTASFAAEETDFVRMNRGKVRQPGTVSQRYLSVRLIDGRRHAEHTITLAGEPGVDRGRALAALRGLRTALADAVEDPHLLLPAAPHSSRDVRGGTLPTAEAAVDAILAAAEGTDFVGLYAGGPVFRGFANSEGQRNWHAVTTFNLQWSLYHRADKAVKSAYAGFDWDANALVARMHDARERLALLARPAKTLAPGAYRAYLTPAAMEELTSILSWGGFSGRALATKQSPLTRMETGERMDPRITLTEDTAHGVAAAFQGEGFDRPPEVALVREGALVGSLVSPRTAREFGLAANGANGYEVPEALAMDAGELPARDALAALDRGLYVGNLHYLNYSDRTACRVTGMTRFATFWVEGGRIVAPVDVLRFDDTIYRLLGSNLEALTAEREMLLSSESYGSRQLTSAHVPGALVSEMAFTL